jgi:splicing factor 3B subunit 3
VRLVDSSALTRGGVGVGPSAGGAGATHHVLELAGDEAALSVACVSFHDHGDEHFVVVGCATGMTLHPRRARSCAIHTYRVVAVAAPPPPADAAASASAAAAAAAGPRYRLRLVHRTPVDEPPLALAAFQGRLLAGVGASLRLFDLGLKRLLFKCGLRGLPTCVQGLQTSLDRIVVSDAQESVLFVKYRRAENSLALVADDVASRHMSCALMLDHDTVMGADKFGSVFVLRLPADVSDDIDGAGGGAAAAGGAGAGALGSGGARALLAAASGGAGAPNKVAQVASFYVGACVTSLQKAVLTAGGTEVVLYATAAGAVGALVPLAARDEVELFSKLEAALRAEGSAGGGQLTASIVAREHMAFRSAFAPVSHVLDGDLCEAGFAALAPARQRELAAELDRTVPELAKALEAVRQRVQ